MNESIFHKVGTEEKLENHVKSCSELWTATLLQGWNSSHAPTPDPIVARATRISQAPQEVHSRDFNFQWRLLEYFDILIGGKQKLRQTVLAPHDTRKKKKENGPTGDWPSGNF